MGKIKRSCLFKIMSSVLIFTFISLDISYAYPPEHNAGNSTLATLPASQNPIVKREILAALQRTQIRYAESEDAIRLLNVNNAQCLLLSSGKYLVTKEVAQNDLKLLRVIIHEDVEAIMQILIEEGRRSKNSKYQGIKELILKYFSPTKDNKLPIELYVNHTVARAFEWLLLVKEGVVLREEVPSSEKDFVRTIEKIINANKHNYFTAEFWDSRIRSEKIRGARNNGMVFYQATASSSIPAVKKPLSVDFLSNLDNISPKAKHKAKNDLYQGRKYAPRVVPKTPQDRILRSSKDAVDVALSSGMKVIIVKNRAQMTELAVKVLTELQKRAQGRHNVGLATGRTPEHIRLALAMPDYLQSVMGKFFDWSMVDYIANLDDYYWDKATLLKVWQDVGPADKYLYVHREKHLSWLRSVLPDAEKKYLSSPIGTQQSPEEALKIFHDLLKDKKFLFQMWGVGTAGGHGGFNEPGCEPLSGDKIVPLTFLTKVQKMKYPSDGFIRADERKVSPIIQQFAGEMQIYEEDGLKSTLQKAVENWQERGEIPHCLAGIENIETDWPTFCQNFEEEWNYLISLTKRIPTKAVTQGTGSAMSRAYFNLVVADGSYKRTSVHNVLENPVNSEGTLSVLQLAPNSCFIIEETAAEYLHNRDDYFLYKPEGDEWKAFEDAKIEDSFMRYGQRQEWSRIWQNREEKEKSLFLEGLFKSGFISGGAKVLSLGCGDGVDEISMAEKGCAVTATDFVKKCVDLTAKRAVEHNVKDRVAAREQNLLEPLSFSNNYFDMVYANGSLHYFNDRQMKNIIGEVWRVLKQGGRLCIKVRSKDDFRYERAKLEGLLIDKDTYLMPDGVICRFFSQVAIKELLAPFIDVEVKPIEEASPDGTVSNMLEITSRKPANNINERIRLAHSRMMLEGVVYAADSYKEEFGVSLTVAKDELEGLASLDHEEKVDDTGRIVDPLSGIEKTYPGKPEAPYMPDYEKGPIYRKMVISPEIFRAFDIRDVTDINLSDKAAFYVGLGFARLLPGFVNKNGNLWITVGQDVREGGKRLRESVIRGLMAGGINVYDMVGDGHNMFLCTPEIYFSTTLLEADGGLNITASHRDRWSNGIKQCIRTEDGYVTNLGREHMEKIKRIVMEREKIRLSVKKGTRIEVPSRTISEYHKKLVENDIFLGPEAASMYLKTWRNTPPDKREPIRKVIDEINTRYRGEKPLAGMVAVMDLNNGAGQRGPLIYRELGAECVMINDEPDGKYPQHDPDPAITKNLSQLMMRMSWCALREELRLIKNRAYHKKEVVGLSYDSDADRLGVVSSGMVPLDRKEIEKCPDLQKYADSDEPPDSVELEFEMDDLYGKTKIYYNHKVLAEVKTKIILADRLTLMLGKPVLETVFGKGGIIINDVKASSKECNEYVSLLGGRYIEERTGFFNIKDRIRKEESKGNKVIVGGELSCHLYVSEWRNWRSDNALFMGANVLALIAQARAGKNIGVSQKAGERLETLKDLDDDIPSYPSTPEIRIPLSVEYTIDQRERLLVQPVIERLRSQRVEVSTIDGGKFVFYDENKIWQGTVLLRKSNTENSLSVRAWGRTREIRDKLKDRVVELVPDKEIIMAPVIDVNIDKPGIETIDKDNNFAERFKGIDNALVNGEEALISSECEKIYQALDARTLPRFALYQFLLLLEKQSRSDSAELVKRTLVDIDKEKASLVPINYRGREILFSKITGFIYYKGTIRAPTGVRTLAHIWDHIPSSMKKLVFDRGIKPDNVELYFTNENVDGINLTVLADPVELNLPFWIRNAGHTNGSYLEAYEVVAATKGAEVVFLSVKNGQARYVMAKEGDIVIDNPLTYTEVLSRGGWVFLADTMRDTRELQAPNMIGEQVKSDYSDKGIVLPIEKSFTELEKEENVDWQNIRSQEEKLWDNIAVAVPLGKRDPLHVVVSNILGCADRDKSSVVHKNDIRDALVPYFSAQYFSRIKDVPYADSKTDNLKDAVRYLNEHPRIIYFEPQIIESSWGGRTASDGTPAPLRKLMRLSASDKSAAEIWYGAYAKVPCKANIFGYSTTLDKLIPLLSEEMLGPEMVNKFGHRMPFLFKFLDANSPASIQCHPNKMLAAELHSKDPVNYPDPYGKPEAFIAVAQEGFSSFAGIKPIDEFLRIMEHYSPGISERYITENHGENFDRASFVKKELKVILESGNQALVDEVIPKIMNYYKAKKGHVQVSEEGTVHFLNHGLVAEIGANSDNTIRAGNTPKRIDILDFIRAANFMPQRKELTKFQDTDVPQVKNCVTTEMFVLNSIELGQEESLTLRTKGSFHMLIAYEGSATIRVSDGPDINLSSGQACLVPASFGNFQIVSTKNNTEIFDAYVPVPAAGAEESNNTSDRGSSLVGQEYNNEADPYDSQSATVLLTDLLYAQLHEDRSYEIKYDNSRLTASQIEIIEEYAKLLQLRSSNPDSIKLRPFSSAQGSKESLIAVYCTGKDFKGEGHVDVAIPDGELKEYLLRIAGMVNIALASSNIPDNLSREDVDEYRPIMSYIKNQYKAILGEELVIPDSPEDILKIIRRIVLGLPKSMRMNTGQIEEFNRLAKQALTAA